MRAILFCLLLCVGVAYSYEQQKPNAANTQSNEHQTGTEQRPFIVKAASANTEEERKYEEYEKSEKPANERLISFSTVMLAAVTALLAIFTGGLWFATFNLSREAKRTATKQASDVEASIREASRSATAMERLAEAMTANVQLITKLQENLPKQMRAYVHINIGTSFYQTEHGLFQVRPILENSGFTPARNVSYSINANIFDTNIPNNFIFPVPPFEISSTTGMSPRQTFYINSPTIPRIPDNEVNEVMNGERRRVFVWGKINYEDVFGQPHFTNFCYSVFFVPNGQGGVDAFGNYHSAHNDAN